MVQGRQGLISVVVPCWNSSTFIEPTLNSICGQAYNNLEVIFVDDASSDTNELEELLDFYGFKVNVKLVKHVGAAAARNKGAELAKGEYLFFCDSDVALDRFALAKMIQTLQENKQCSWTYCNFTVGEQRRSFGAFNAFKLREQNFCSTMSMMLSKDFPSFDESLKRLQDWDLFIRLSKQGKQGVWIDEFLFHALDRPDGITKNSISWEEAFKVLKAKYGGRL